MDFVSLRGPVGAVAISRYKRLSCCHFSMGYTRRLPRRFAPRNDSSFGTLAMLNNNLAQQQAQEFIVGQGGVGIGSIQDGIHIVGAVFDLLGVQLGGLHQIPAQMPHQQAG